MLFEYLRSDVFSNLDWSDFYWQIKIEPLSGKEKLEDHQYENIFIEVKWKSVLSRVFNKFVDRQSF